MSDDVGPVAKSSDPPKNRRRRILILVTGLGLIVWSAIEIVHLERAPARALRLLRQQRPTEAETELFHYLRFHPRSPEAILLWAQAVISGEVRTPREAATLAISRLQLIPENSAQAGEARMREGRLTLLILHQPALAESLLMRSIELNPNLLDSHYLLWQLFDMTERFQQSEPHFWKTYDLSDESARAERLREWYVSQFSPSASTAELDRQMGFLKSGEFPGPESDIARLEEFYSSEPDSPLIVAALAQWYLRNHQRDEALQILMRIRNRNEALQSPFYVATSVAVLLEMGKLDEAKSNLEQWPKPTEGFVYWSTAGKVFDLVDRDDAAAVSAYDRALAIWPGPAEWSLMHRKAQCLARLGKKAEAEAVRNEARRVELQMEATAHQELRAALANLDSPETSTQMIDFYESLNREQEASCWRDIRNRLSINVRLIYSNDASAPRPPVKFNDSTGLER